VINPFLKKILIIVLPVLLIPLLSHFSLGGENLVFKVFSKDNNAVIIHYNSNMKCEEAILIKVIYPCKLISGPALIVSKGNKVTGGRSETFISRDLGKIYLSNGSVVDIGHVEWFLNEKYIKIFIGKNFVKKIDVEELKNNAQKLIGYVNGYQVKLFITFAKVPRIDLNYIPEDIRKPIEERALQIFKNNIFLKWLDSNGFNSRVISVKSYPHLEIDREIRLIFVSSWIETLVHTSKGSTKICYSIDLKKKYVVSLSEYRVPEGFTLPPSLDERIGNIINIYIIGQHSEISYCYSCSKKETHSTSEQPYPSENISEDIKTNIMKLLEENDLTRLLLKEGCVIKRIHVEYGKGKIWIYISVVFEKIDLDIHIEGTDLSNLYIDRITVFLG